MVKRFRILLIVAAAAALVIYLLSDDPPKRYPPEQGTLRVHGTLWPNMQLELGYSYRTNSDIDDCRTRNWPVTDWSELRQGQTIKGAADERGRYDIQVRIEPPRDGGRCQWNLHVAWLTVHLGPRDDVQLYAYASKNGNPSKNALTIQCYRYDGDEESYGCAGGDGFFLDLLPFDEHGRRELEFNIERVDPPPVLNPGLPLDQMVGSPAYNARIRREQEAAERLSSSPDPEPDPGSP